MRAASVSRCWFPRQGCRAEDGAFQKIFLARADGNDQHFSSRAGRDSAQVQGRVAIPLLVAAVPRIIWDPPSTVEVSRKVVVVPFMDKISAV